jgi:hypothetical protein
MKNRNFTICLLISWCLLFPLVLHADVFMKQKVHTDPFEMMGKAQPAKDVIQTTWLTTNGIRNDTEEGSMIIKADKNVMIMLNNTQKTYQEIPLDFSAMAKNVAKDDEKGAQDFQKMMSGMMKVKLTVTPTNETKKIGVWNCKKYLQQLETPMGPSNTEVWASEDIKVNFELYSKLALSMFAQMPGMKENLDEISKEVKKIKGVSVFSKTSMNIMGKMMNSSTELLEVKDGSAPAGILDVPAGYKKSEGQPFGDR